MPADLAGNVTLVHENVGGLTRRTWAARLGGCYINGGIDDEHYRYKAYVAIVKVKSPDVHRYH